MSVLISGVRALHLMNIVEVLPVGAAIMARRENWVSARFIEIFKLKNGAPDVRCPITGEQEFIHPAEYAAGDWEALL